MIWQFQNSSYYVPEAYTGSVCRSYLLAWQDCAVGPTDSGNVAINAFQDQTMTEQLLSETIKAVG